MNEFKNKLYKRFPSAKEANMFLEAQSLEVMRAIDAAELRFHREEDFNASSLVVAGFIIGYLAAEEKTEKQTELDFGSGVNTPSPHHFNGA